MKLLALFTVFIVAVHCQGWTMVWNDEFDGTTLNRTKWQPEVNCWGGGNAELQCYTARTQNIRVTGGNLVLTAIPETYTGTAAGCTHNAGCTDTKRFTSGRIRSVNDPSGSFLRGRFEIRAKLPKGKHLWPAFWMLPTDYDYGNWAASGEIDILEARGQESNLLESTLHHGGVWPNNMYTGSGKKNIGVDASADFHVYAAEWDENEIKFWFDNNNYHTMNLNRNWCTPGVPNCPYTRNGQPWDRRMHMLLNLAIGGGFFNGYSPLTDADVRAWTSTSFVIDYVRVYKRSAGTTTGVPTTPSTTGSATTGSVTTGSTTPAPTGSADAVILIRAPETIVANGMFNVTVAYVAPLSRDIVVDVLNSQTYAWFGKGIVNVPAGKGFVTVTINGVNDAPAGNNYQYKVWSVEAGVAGTDGDWTKAINEDFRTVVVGNTWQYAECV